MESAFLSSLPTLDMRGKRKFVESRRFVGKPKEAKEPAAFLVQLLLVKLHGGSRYRLVGARTGVSFPQVLV
jgi:hypothetical protein